VRQGSIRCHYHSSAFSRCDRRGQRRTMGWLAQYCTKRLTHCADQKHTKRADQDKIRWVHSPLVGDENAIAAEKVSEPGFGFTMYLQDTETNR
jgi:hypothetical protein